MDAIIDTVINILLLPLQLVIAPIDMLLNRINGLEVIPQSLAVISSFIGNIPSTLVNLTGLSPIIWNLFFTVFITYIALAPAINIIKKVWAWVRP